MRIPDTYRGDLRYRKGDSGQRFSQLLEFFVLREVEDLVIHQGQAISLHVFFRDYGELKVQTLPLINTENWDEAMDWYHENCYGEIVRMDISGPHQKPNTLPAEYYDTF